MRLIARSALLAGAIMLVSACGGATEEEKEVPGNEQITPTPSTSARPVSFGLCAMCHSDVAGKNGLGPSLFGVVGRKAGSAPAYSYSPALKASNVIWDEATIDRFIAKPRDVVPGTKMSYAGLNDPEKRAEITAYLATLK